MNALSGSLNMSVLICSSSRPLQQSLEALLNAMGCQAISGASTAAEAREQLALQHHDLALIDEGFESDTQALAGHSVPSLKLTTRRNEPGLTLFKPFRPADLAERMQACVQRLEGGALAANSQI